MQLKLEVQTRDGIWRESEVQGLIAHVQQFGERWRARWADGNPREPIFVSGDLGTTKSLAYDEQTQTFSFPDENKKLPKSTQEPSQPSVGTVHFIDANGGLLSPQLYIQPSSLTENDFTVIIHRLQALALDHQTHTLQPVPTQSGFATVSPNSTHLGSLLDQLLRVAQELVSLREVAQRAWPQLNKQPSLHLKAVKTPLPRSKALRRARGEAALERAPDSRQVHVTVAKRSEVTLENRFLAYLWRIVLIEQSKQYILLIEGEGNKWKDRQQRQDEYRKKVLFELKKIDENLVWMKDISKRAKQERNRAKYIQELSYTQERCALNQANLEEIQQKISDLTIGVRWAEETLEKSWLKSIEPLSRPPYAPTPQLTRSPGYSDLYSAFGMAQRIMPVGRPIYSEQALLLNERSVRASSKLYEVWVFFEAYESLKEFGFTRESKDPSPLSNISVSDQGLVELKGKEFRLFWKMSSLDGAPFSIEAKLYYDTCLKVSLDGKTLKRCPDVRVDFSWIDSAGKQTEAAIYLDAKYRNYADVDQHPPFPEYTALINKYGSMLTADLLETARQRYLRDLAKRCPASKTAFILHSDVTVPAYWGGRPFKRAMSGQRFTHQDDEFSAHQYGSLPLVPTGKTKQTMQTFWWMVFSYHLGITNICFNCAVPTSNKSVPDGWGIVHSCPECHDWWVDNKCGRERHPIIKHPEYLFHTRVEEATGLYFYCPECDKSGLPRKA